MTGCSFSIKLGDKEITNTTAAEETEETEKETESKAKESTVSSKHKTVDREDESTAEATTPAETRGSEVETVPSSVHTDKGNAIPLDNGYTVYYGGEDLHISGIGQEARYTNGNDAFGVMLMSDDEAVGMAAGMALIKHGDSLSSEYRAEIEEAFSDMETELEAIKEIKGYTWTAGSDSNNLDAAYLDLTLPDVGACTLFVVFTGNDSNIAIIQTSGMNIPIESYGVVNGNNELWVADAREIDLGVWLQSLLDSSGMSPASDSLPSTGLTSSEDGSISVSGNNVTLKSESGKEYKAVIPSGWKVTYETDSCVSIQKGEDWHTEISLWAYEYFGSETNEHLVSPSGMDVYAWSNEYVSYYNFVIDDGCYAEVTLNKEDNPTVADAENMLLSYLNK